MDVGVGKGGFTVSIEQEFCAITGNLSIQKRYGTILFVAYCKFYGRYCVVHFLQKQSKITSICQNYETIIRAPQAQRWQLYNIRQNLSFEILHV